MNDSLAYNGQVDQSLYVKLGPAKKLGYALGDMANNFSWAFTSSFLMIFYTDVFGISAAAVSIMMLVSRLWDAVNDPMIGILADRTHTKWGRYRPWVLFGALPLGLATVLTFWAHPSFSNTGKLVYAYITYSILVFAYTAVNIPYSAMTATLTQDPRERGSLGGYRLTLSFLCSIIVSYMVTYLVPRFGGGDNAKGYLLTAVLMAVVIGCPLYLLCFKSTKEIVPPPADNKVAFWKMVRITLQNKPLLILLAGFFLVGFANYGRNAAFAYYFTYVVGKPLMLGTYVLFLNVPFLFGSFTSPYLSDWFKSKGRNYAVAALIFGVLLIVTTWISPLTSSALFFGLTIITGYCNGVQAAAIYGMLPDVVEYGELQSGIRAEGFISSYTSLWNKIGMAISTAGVAGLLAMLGYRANAATQAPSVLAGVTTMMFLIPGILSIITGAVFLFYKLDYATFDNILVQIQAKKQNATSAQS
jgi:probable glucitol transport protein GutA